MKKPTTLTAVVPAANIEEAWQEVGANFERFCLTAGLATLSTSRRATRLCARRAASCRAHVRVSDYAQRERRGAGLERAADELAGD